MKLKTKKNKNDIIFTCFPVIMTTGCSKKNGYPILFLG